MNTALIDDDDGSIFMFDIWVKSGAIVRYVFDEVTLSFVVSHLIFSTENPIRFIALNDSYERLYEDS